MDTCCHFPEVIQLLSRPKNNSWVFWICRLESNTPIRSLFPLPCSLFSIPCSLFSLPCSLFSLPCSLFPLPCSLFPLPSYAKRLHCKIAVHAGDDHVAVGGAEGSVDHQQIAVADSRAGHRVALDAHEVGGGRTPHQQFVQVERRFQILFSRRREPRNDRAGHFSPSRHLQSPLLLLPNIFPDFP